MSLLRKRPVELAASETSYNEQQSSGSVKLFNELSGTQTQLDLQFAQTWKRKAASVADLNRNQVKYSKHEEAANEGESISASEQNMDEKDDDENEDVGDDDADEEHDDEDNEDESLCSSKETTQTGAATSKEHKPRRRVATQAQRRAANIRERRRMFNLNSAFDKLRRKVPAFAYEKRLSRIETLKLAIMYIRFMNDLVADEEYAEKFKDWTARSPPQQYIYSPLPVSSSCVNIESPTASNAPVCQMRPHLAAPEQSQSNLAVPKAENQHSSSSNYVYSQSYNHQALCDQSNINNTVYSSNLLSRQSSGNTECWQSSMNSNLDSSHSFNPSLQENQTPPANSNLHVASISASPINFKTPRYSELCKCSDLSLSSHSRAPVAYAVSNAVNARCLPLSSTSVYVASRCGSGSISPPPPPQHLSPSSSYPLSSSSPASTSTSSSSQSPSFGNSASSSLVTLPVDSAPAASAALAAGYRPINVTANSPLTHLSSAAGQQAMPSGDINLWQQSRSQRQQSAESGQRRWHELTAI